MSVMELSEDFNPRLEAYKNPVARTYSSGLGATIQNSANGEVQSAINRFNGQETYNMKLAVVGNESLNRQELPAFDGQMALATHNQIARSNENFPAPNFPAFYDMYRALATQTPTGEFNLGRMFEQSISLSDNRRLHGGRMHSIRPKNTYKLRKTSDKGDYVTAFSTGLMFARSKNYQESGEGAMIPDNLSKGKCAFCGVLSHSYCNRCREVFYCCLRCQASHWAEHQLVCGKRDGGRTTRERKNGLAATKSVNLERNINNMSSRENSIHIDESKHETQGLRRPDDANMYLRPSPKKTSPPNYSQKKQQSVTKSNAFDTSSGSKQTVTDDNDRKSDSSEMSSYSKKNKNALKTRPKTTPASAPKKAQQPSNQSKVEVTATTAVESKIQVKKRVEAGMVKNVCVTSADSLTDLWVVLQADKSGLDDLGNELNKDLAAQLPPFAINVFLACGLSSADAQTEFPVRFLSENERGQWTVEKAQDNEVSKLEEAKPLEVDSGSQAQSSSASLQACAVSPPSSSASTTSLPYFKEGEIYEVFAQDCLDPTEFFVTKVDKKEDLEKLQKDLNCEISDSSQQLENIEVNSKCAAKYAGDWYRASVQKLDPLTVLYIDFGNEEICKPADLKELPPRFRKGLYTVRIRLPGPASKEQLVAMNSGAFKLRVAKKEGKYWLADFATDEVTH
ncbi:hypothetical protein LSTR_LSTR015369 [Laodelphax striatellus]|uniref:MYND-type domain-containing protein n=1 Tax=Laodelphax striatellus TaxID=195883 RepID=A0A482WIX2_LAOST|nr:hypothetical protein LSTR_LSTR015369 [Laodelphax striatellus]